MTLSVKKFIYLLLGLAILATAFFLWLYRDTYLYGLGKVTSYQECVKAGGSVLPGKKQNSCFYNNKLYNEPANETSEKSQIDTSTLKTYKNTTYGFEFQYSSKFCLNEGSTKEPTEGSDQDVYVIKVLSNCPVQSNEIDLLGQDRRERLQIEVRKYDKSLDEFLTDNNANNLSLSRSDRSYEKKSTISFNGLPGYSITFSCPSDGPCEGLGERKFIKDNGYIYEFSESYLSEDGNKFDYGIFDPILSTFKFTN